MKINKYKLSLFLITLFFNTAFAWVEWNYTGASHSWNNPANWGGHVPGALDDPIIRGQGPGNEALIESGVSALGRTMWIGYSGQADLVVTGGSLTLSGNLRLGQGDAGGKANMVLSEGSVDVYSDIVLGDGAGGIAELTITGGQFNQLGGWFYVGYYGASGKINLNGGTLTTFKVVLDSSNARLNITNGKLIITNLDSVGVISEINNYVQSGLITFFDGNPQAEYKATVNSQGYTEITASIRGADVWMPSPANQATGVELNPQLSWMAGTTSTHVLPELINFKDDPCFCEFSGTAVYTTEFDVTDMQRTILSLGKVYGISEVTLNGTNLGHKWHGAHIYDVSNSLRIGTNILEVKIITTLSNFFSVWDNPVAQIWTRDRQPVSEGMTGPVRLLKKE